jgi:cytochrome oxidase Cu insertion factor (SCO1/SenC/PrrC family)
MTPRSVGVLIASMLAAVLCVACQPTQPPMDVYGSTPTFQLTDQSGATIDSKSLAGHVTLLDFIYTHCTDACPILSATFQDTQRKLAQDNLLGSKVMLVSLSVDPQHDTPPVLAEYGQQFKADASSWKMLTGDWDQVYDVVTGFKVATRPPRPAADAPVPGGTELTHTTAVVLIDPQLQVRAYLDGAGMTSDDLVAAARKLVK